MSLEEQASIERGFTALVWQKLEEQNEDFFRAYYTRLKLKDQIVLFNHLLEQQVQMVHRIRASAAWMAPNGEHTPPPPPPLPPHINSRLKLKDQIVPFKHLLEQQVQMVHRIRASAAWMAPDGVPPLPLSPPPSKCRHAACTDLQFLQYCGSMSCVPPFLPLLL